MLDQAVTDYIDAWDRRLKVGSSVNPRATKDRKSISSSRTPAPLEF